MKRPVLMMVFCFVCVAAVLPCKADNVRLTNATGSSQRPVVCIDASGAVVAWQDDRDGNFEIYWRRFNRLGVPVTAEIRVTNTAGKSVRPDISCDGEGNSFLVWQEGDNVNGVGDVQFAALDANGAVTAGPITLKTLSGNARISSRSGGTSDIVFHHFSVADQYVYFQRRDATWTLLCEKKFWAATIPAIAKTPSVAALSSQGAIVWLDVCQFCNVALYNGTVSLGCGQSQAQLVDNRDAINPDIDGDPSSGVAWIIFQLSGYIRYYTGGNGCVIAGTGAASLPRVATDSAKGFATWQDTRDGNSEIYMCRFYGCSSETGDVRLTSDGSASQYPDIATPRDGSGEWVIVWQDNRDGNWEVYFESNLEPATIRLTGQVRPEHAAGAFESPAPPLEGVTVTLNTGSQVLGPEVTNSDGVATFLTSPVAGATYTMSLTGPYYDTHIHHKDGTTPIPSLDCPMDDVFSRTNFEWPNGSAIENGPSVQLVYFLSRFRRDFWLDRFGYEWRLPTRDDPGSDSNALALVIRDFPFEKGRCLGDACPSDPEFKTLFFRPWIPLELDAVGHEYTHVVIPDRFKALADHKRPIGKSTTEGYAMDEAFCDYFAATFTNDPVIEGHRNIDNNERRPYPDFRYTSSHDGSKSLSGALWDLRQLIDGNEEVATETDPLVFAALDSMVVWFRHVVETIDFTFIDYYVVLKMVDQQVWGGQHAVSIDEAFEEHNISETPDNYTPLKYIVPDVISGLEAGFDNIQIWWRRLPEAFSYEVRKSTVYRGTGIPGIGPYTIVASGLTDTTCVIKRDAKTEYLLTIAPVDEFGQAGIAVEPVYVPCRLPRTPYKPHEQADPRASEANPSRADGSGRFLYNSPNPFNPRTRIVFETTVADRVEVVIYDVVGRRVRALAPLTYGAGVNKVEWDGLDDRGSVVASGTYLIELRGTKWRDTGKVLIVR